MSATIPKPQSPQPFQPQTAIESMCQVPLPTQIQQFLANSGAVNMTMKFLCYYLRFQALYVPKTKAVGDQLIVSLTDCRILTGFWRYIETTWDILKYVSNPPQNHSLWYRVLNMIMLYFRGVGQITGDIRYARDHWFTHWNAMRVLWHYQFSKSVSQAICAYFDIRSLLECYKERQTLRSAKADAEQLSPEEAFEFEKKEKALETRIENLYLSLIRNISDVVVYTQWITWYFKNLPRTIEAIAGMTSGYVTMIMCWRAAGRPAKKK